MYYIFFVDNIVNLDINECIIMHVYLIYLVLVCLIANVHASAPDKRPIETFTGMVIGTHEKAVVMNSIERYVRFTQYEKLHAEIMDVANKQVRRRFLIVEFHPDTGVGNRMLSLASAYAIALVTNRALLVRWSATNMRFRNNMSYQVDIAMLFQDPGIQWRYNSFSPKTVRQLRVLARDQVKHVVFPELMKHDNLYPIFLCGDYAKEYDSWDTIIWKQTQDFYLPMFQLNGERGDMAKQLWYIFGEDAFANIATHIFRPVPEIVSRVHIALANLPLQFTALHLRIRHFTRLNYTNAIQCAGSSNIIVVITDDKSILPTLRMQGPFRSVANISLDRRTLEGQRDALVEMWIMANAKEIVATEVSTYAAVAYGMARIKPRILRFDGSCWDRLVSEPFQWSYFYLEKKQQCARKKLYQPAAQSLITISASDARGSHVHV